MLNHSDTESDTSVMSNHLYSQNYQETLKIRDLEQLFIQQSFQQQILKTIIKITII